MQGAFGLGQAIPNQFPLGVPFDRTQFYGATQGNPCQRESVPRDRQQPE